MDPKFCEFCGCLRDDHTPLDEVEDGIPFRRDPPGETITCGDCADCRVDPRTWDPPKGSGWLRDALDLIGDLSARNIRILHHLRETSEAHYWPNTSAFCSAIYAARKSGAPTIRALVTHWDGYDGAPDGGWNSKWWDLLEAAEEAAGVPA